MKNIIKNLFLCLSAITFYFEGNTLYWSIDGKHRPESYLQLQLDSLSPPTINQDPIVKIKTKAQDILYIYTKDKYWILYFKGNPIENWEVSEWRWI